MRVGRILWFAAGLTLAVLAGFVLVAPALPAWIADPASWQRAATPGVAVAGVLLLALDVLLPVPSSIVMTANGALFGAGAGTALSMLGGVLSAVLGYGLGRLLRRPALGPSAEVLGPFLDRHGTVALVVSRPIPVAAEVVAVLAGSARLPRRRFLAAVAAGSLATSLPYALAGAHATGAAAWWALSAALVLATAAWTAGRLLHHRTPDAEEAT